MSLSASSLNLEVGVNYISSCSPQFLTLGDGACMGWEASQQKWGKGVETLWFHVPVRKLPSCGTQNDTRLHSLVQTVTCMQKNFLSKLQSWDICRQRPYGSKPISFSHTVLTTGWILRRQLHFPTSTQAGESLDLARTGIQNGAS